MNLYLSILVAIFFISISAPVNADSHKALKFAASAKSSDIIVAYHQLIQKAYKKLGYEVELVQYPLKRGFIHANRGYIDGLLLMPDSELESYPNLRTVPIPLVFIELSVYSITEDFKIEGAKSLKPFKIGILKDYPLSFKLTEGLDRHESKDYRSLFRALKSGRIDVALAVRWESNRFIIDHSEFKNVKMLTPPLYSLPLYNILNQKHAEIIPKIKSIIEDLLNKEVLNQLVKDLYQKYGR